MKIKYIAEGSPLSCIKGKLYELIAIEPGPGGDWARVIDESGEDYLYPITAFEIADYKALREAFVA